MSTMPAPCSLRYLMVGMAALMRVSSVTTPSFRGTLKSTRMMMRLPSTSMSRTVFLVKAMFTPLVVDTCKEQGRGRGPKAANRAP